VALVIVPQVADHFPMLRRRLGAQSPLTRRRDGQDSLPCL
jgi:hypothetical protein